jgi:hypothetical protein
MTMNITVELPRDAALLKHMAKFKPRKDKRAEPPKPEQQTPVTSPLVRRIMA